MMEADECPCDACQARLPAALAELVQAARKLVEVLERDQHYFGDEYEALCAALAKVQP